jgi:hypothetical protein
MSIRRPFDPQDIATYCRSLLLQFHKNLLTNPRALTSAMHALTSTRIPIYAMTLKILAHELPIDRPFTYGGERRTSREDLYKILEVALGNIVIQFTSLSTVSTSVQR